MFLRCVGTACLTVEGTTRENYDKITSAIGWPLAPVPTSTKSNGLETSTDAPPNCRSKQRAENASRYHSPSEVPANLCDEWPSASDHRLGAYPTKILDILQARRQQLERHSPMLFARHDREPLHAVFGSRGVVRFRNSVGEEQQAISRLQPHPLDRVARC